MVSQKTLHCNLLTPDRQVLDGEATFVALPAHDGEIGFLCHRAPLVCKLGTGGLRINASEGDRRFFIDGGFAHMLNNQLTILTDRAESAEDLTVERTESELREAHNLPADDADARTARQAAVLRARARLRFARRLA